MENDKGFNDITKYLKKRYTDLDGQTLSRKVISLKAILETDIVPYISSDTSLVYTKVNLNKDIRFVFFRITDVNNEKVRKIFKLINANITKAVNRSKTPVLILYFMTDEDSYKGDFDIAFELAQIITTVTRLKISQYTHKLKYLSCVELETHPDENIFRHFAKATGMNSFLGTRKECFKEMDKFMSTIVT